MQGKFLYSCASALITASTIMSAEAVAAPGAPVYSRFEDDCVTGDTQRATTDGKNVWTIKAGCDSYQNEFYERPTAQTYALRNLAGGGTAFAAKEYFQNLDIKSIKAGADSTFMYVAIEMFGNGRITEDGILTTEGLKYQYEFLLSRNVNGAGGYLFSVETPTVGPAWSAKAAKGFQDTNGDVGGLGISYTKEDDQANGGSTTEVTGNGFDLARIDDGFIKNGPNENATVLFTRAQGNIVEFALEYGKLSYSLADITTIINGGGFLDFRTNKGGPKDAANYLWNDEYSRNEAGSPYRCGTTAIACSDLTKSEFGTQGLGSIYEVDTFRLAAIPEPATWAMMIGGFAMAGAAMRRRTRAVLA